MPGCVTFTRHGVCLSPAGATGLVLLASGRHTENDVNIDELLEQGRMLRGFWVGLAQLPMSHPSPCVGWSVCSAWASSRRRHLPPNPAAEAEIDHSGLDPVELDQLPARREYDLSMLLLGIILFGMLIGAAAQLIVGRSAKGVDWGLALAAGLVGSFIGGLLVSLLSGDGLAFRPSGIIGSLAGAIIVTLVWHWWRTRRAESRR